MASRNRGNQIAQICLALVNDALQSGKINTRHWGEILGCMFIIIIIIIIIIIVVICTFMLRKRVCGEQEDTHV